MSFTREHRVALKYLAGCGCGAESEADFRSCGCDRHIACGCEGSEDQPTESPAERSEGLDHWEPSVDHGYGQPLSGGTDIMKRLQDSLLIEQGKPTRTPNPRLASQDSAEVWLSHLLSLLRAQHWDYWTSHWQVRGDAFYGDHLMFERLYTEDLQTEIDALAEKMVAYFGTASVQSVDQIQKAHQWISRWSVIEDPLQRALRTEADFQTLVKKSYDFIQGSKDMTLGLDDFLMAMANRHETNTYLLQQRLQVCPASLEQKWASLGRA